MIAVGGGCAIVAAIGGATAIDPPAAGIGAAEATGAIAHLIDLASLACVAAGLVAGGLVLATRGPARLALAVALDFWLAAGLLRLSLPASWQAMAAAAAILGIRLLLRGALRHPADAPPPGPAPVSSARR
ncbi:hypothetical protein [Catellatospora tritici]|uniref:hypothetical protein n=1 Tax=Catellatospora tritici TaxID=2851566 RepID=UPI001C2DE221|nr:hypothetical protein [Catellatospora tritici]MBV1854735.1 hypothetical protein [Catellatospora tritici]